MIFRGVPFLEEADGLVEEIRGAVEDSLARSAEEETEIDLLQTHLHDDVAEFVYEAAQAPAHGGQAWSWRSSARHDIRT